jgi:hypothetical protein
MPMLRFFVSHSITLMPVFEELGIHHGDLHAFTGGSNKVKDTRLGIR